MLSDQFTRLRDRASRTLRTRRPAPTKSNGHADPTSETELPRALGVVETFNARYIVGWVQVPEGLPPTPVTLQVGKLQISSTYPTADAPLSGISVAAESDDDQPPSQPEELSKYRGVAKGRLDRRRNAGRNGQQIRAFSFQVQEIWGYLLLRSRVTVRFNGHPLPIVGHGMFLSPTQRGKKTPQELAARLDDGYVLNQFGKFTLSKQQDVEWQANVLDLYERTRTVVNEKFGYEVFGIYGTLLGAIREGGYIGHDVDFDSGYISSKRTGPEAAEELVEIALALLESGLKVDLRHRMLHIRDAEDPQWRIDLFHTFFNHQGELRFPWGVAGESTICESEWQGTKAIDFPGGKLQVPVDAEKFVAHLYGEDWRLPKPGFNWTLSRTDVADDAVLTRAQRTKVYWANFYARHEYDSGSTFCEFLAARDDMPQTVIDIGCGDGRDSRAFAAGGRRALGLDQSPVGVEHANSQAADAGLSERASFEVCDVSDATALAEKIGVVVQRTEGPIAFYLRFFLHAINENAQETLMSVIRDQSRPGDIFTAEFRTDKDEANTKTHGNHYRRFQNAEAFHQSLEEEYGFEVLYDHEGQGLSVYGDEDPVLYRVIARRS